MVPGGGDKAYLGEVGQTRRERVCYATPSGALVPVQVYRCVNVATDSELGARLADGTLNQVVLASGEQVMVNVAVLYHDPRERLFVLVVSDSARHTELEERAAVIAALQKESEHPIPGYVRDFSVVFGGDELRRYLEHRAEHELGQARIPELEEELRSRTDELGRRTAELDERTLQLAHRDETLQAREQTLSAQREELERLEKRIAQLTQELRDKGARLERQIAEAETKVAVSPPRAPDGDPEGTPLPLPLPHDAVDTHPFELLSKREMSELGVDQDADELTTVHGRASSYSPGNGVSRDSVTEDTARTVVAFNIDAAIERWIADRKPSLKLVDHGRVHFAASCSPEILEALLGTTEPADSSDASAAMEGAADHLDVRIQLHRFPTYPLVVLSVGRSEAPDNRLEIELNVADPEERAVLLALGKNFAFRLDLYDNEYLLVRTNRLRRDLADNCRYVVTAADQHLNSIGPADRSYSRALRSWTELDYDRYGVRDPRYRRYRAVDFNRLDTLRETVAAISVAAEFSRPADEAFLLLVVGENLARWRQVQSQIAHHAVDLGLWPGADLARLAISEGAAGSPKELIVVLRDNFSRCAVDDADKRISEENWRALDRQSRRFGISTDRSRGRLPTRPPREGNHQPMVSGTIETSAPGSASLAGWTVQQLINGLSDPNRRGETALELVRRRERRGLEPMFRSLDTMTRAEAVQVLGRLALFGDVAGPYLTRGLRSRKAFVRHGSALALAVLHYDGGVEAICDLLLAEPTDVWREVARAVGLVGPAAVAPLAARVREADDEKRARIAWALANVAARGGRGTVETIAQGRDPAAAGLASRALELEAGARSENAQMHGQLPAREQTVNRAFSRKFFEALEATEAGGETLALDESDLVIEEDGGELSPS